MEVVQVLRMNKGNGETSYARNSKVQMKIISMTKGVIEEAIGEILSKKLPESMGIADLGCSSGPNTLLVISEIMEFIYTKCKSIGCKFPELVVFLNDLFTNDFNHVFGMLPEFYHKLKVEKGDLFGNECYVSAVPGSFYGRLFPNKSLHFVHSSSSLHWLSKVPPELESEARRAINKGKIYISKTSPSCVLEAYAKQFHEDFTLFVKSRSEEVIAGGRMVLSLMGRSSMDPTTEDSCYHWELLAHALMSLVCQGLIEEEKVDSFNAPYYAPCIEEVEKVTEKEGSFIVDRIEGFEVDWDGGAAQQERTLSSGQLVAKTIRAVVESMLESHFGGHIMEALFQTFGNLVDVHLAKSRTKYINLVISLLKKDSN